MATSPEKLVLRESESVGEKSARVKLKEPEGKERESKQSPWEAKNDGFLVGPRARKSVKERVGVAFIGRSPLLLELYIIRGYVIIHSGSC